MKHEVDLDKIIFMITIEDLEAIAGRTFTQFEENTIMGESNNFNPDWADNARYFLEELNLLNEGE